MSHASIETRLVTALRAESDRLQIPDGWDAIQRRIRWRPYRRATALALAMALLAGGLVGVRLIHSEPDEANLIGPNPPTKEERQFRDKPRSLEKGGSSQNAAGAAPRSPTEADSGQTTSSGVGASDGDLLAYAGSARFDTNAEIFLGRVGADGAFISEPRNLTGSSSNDYRPAWSPDGRKIAFTSNSHPEHDHTQVYVMNADGSDVRRIHRTPCEPSPGYCGESLPAWSPDGSWIAFVRSYRPATLVSEIWVMRPDGSDAKKLAGGLLPSWSPDGSVIAFIKSDTDVQNAGCTYPLYRQCSGELYVMRPDGSDQRSLGVGEVHAPSWWPDGSRLALSRQNPVTGKSTIWSVRPNGSGLTQITTEEQTADSKWGDWEPTVSPDGRRIVIYRWDTDENSNLVIMDADGTDRKHLTRPGSFDAGSAFAPRPS